MQKYSFLTSIYKNTKVDEMKECVESMVNQTIPPEQIVIVIDGEITQELKDYVSFLSEKNLSFYTLVPLENNVGLGLALREGMKYCRNEMVARMDTDDICELDRCKKQLKIFEEDKTLSIVGSNIEEFIGVKANTIGQRIVPEKHKDICKYLKKRCPFNHMTVMFKKSEIEQAGGYMEWPYNEDNYLWVRAYLCGCKFYNIQENLVHARVGKEMYARRGGYNYFKSEQKLFKYMKNNGIIGFFGYAEAIIIRFVVQVLMTNNVRQWFFKNFARK